MFATRLSVGVCYQSDLSVGIGAWQKVFELMGYLAVITNSALIGLSVYKGNLLPNISSLHLVGLVVALEVIRSLQS